MVFWTVNELLSEGSLFHHYSIFNNTNLMFFSPSWIFTLWVFLIAHRSVLQTVQSYWTECNKMKNREEPVELWKVATEVFVLCFRAAILSTSVETTLIMHPIRPLLSSFNTSCMLECGFQICQNQFSWAFYTQGCK